MDEYVLVRRMHFDKGLSMREIQRRTGINRRTIRKMITQGSPAPYKRSETRQPVLGEVTPLIDAILEQDRGAPRKQRHTARRIWERLVEEHGYGGGYTQVRCYVRDWRMRTKERFVPLAFDPGTAQVDWGEAWVSERGERKKVCLFVMTLPWSNARFVMAFPRESQEYFFEGHLQAFRFFGGVPSRIIYDNLKAAVTKVLRGRHRKLNVAFSDFAEHYLFEPSFCNVRSGNEKGSVEAGVKWAQRRLMTPIPEFVSWGRFNERLCEECLRALERPSPNTGRTIGKRLAEERDHLRPVPAMAPERMRPRPARVDSLSLVRFDSNSYSVPCEFAHREVTVEASVSEVRIYRGDQCIAAHERAHGQDGAVYNPVHYLPLIERKPRTLDNGAPMKEAAFPECFEVLRRRMESGQEHSEGTRAYIRVLRLLEKHDLGVLTLAVTRALKLGAAKEEAVKNLLLCPPERIPTPLDLRGRDHLRCDIPAADLTCYGQLVKGGAS